MKAAPKDAHKERTRYRRPPDVECANCHKLFPDGDMNAIARAIANHQPACSYECNLALGQV